MFTLFQNEPDLVRVCHGYYTMYKETIINKYGDRDQLPRP